MSDHDSRKSVRRRKMVGSLGKPAAAIAGTRAVLPTPEADYYPTPRDARMLCTAGHSLPCRLGNVPRTLLSMPRWMYSKGPDGIYVTRFVGSTVTVDNVRGTGVELVHQTDYPWNGKGAITVNPTRAHRFTVRMRVPSRRGSALYTSWLPAIGILSLERARREAQDRARLSRDRSQVEGRRPDRAVRLERTRRIVIWEFREEISFSAPRRLRHSRAWHR